MCSSVVSVESEDPVNLHDDEPKQRTQDLIENARVEQEQDMYAEDVRDDYEEAAKLPVSQLASAECPAGEELFDLFDDDAQDYPSVALFSDDETVCDIEPIVKSSHECREVLVKLHGHVTKSGSGINVNMIKFLHAQLESPDTAGSPDAASLLKAHQLHVKVDDTSTKDEQLEAKAKSGPPQPVVIHRFDDPQALQDERFRRGSRAQDKKRRWSEFKSCPQESASLPSESWRC